MRRITLMALLALVAACGDMPTESSEQLDLPLALAQADGSSEVDGFYWLPPTVKKESREFSGTFDAGLLEALTVKICDAAGDPLSPGACAAVLYTMSAATQPEILRVNPDPEKEDYSVTWQNTNNGTFTAGNTYRAFVTVAHPSGSEVVLGYVDLLAAERRPDLRGQTLGFVQGSPFVFKFRIEEGLPGALAIQPGSAQLLDIDTPGQSQVFTSTLTDLHGNPLPGRTISWTSSAPLVSIAPSTGTTDGSGSHATTATPTDRVDADTDVTITAVHEGFSATAVLTIKPTPCSLATSIDSDADRLPDCAETNTGVYVGPLDTGTDPLNPDSDGDAISDGDEVLGTTGGLDLPAFGVSPLVPTILIEYDWFDDNGHTHRPTATQIAMVTASFAAQGIQVIHDYGQGTPFTGGNLIADADGNVDGLGPEYYAYKAANFAANRNGYFHYNLHPHQYNNGFSSGLAEINGDDFITATINFRSNDLAVAGTIQHELGHNLGLRHGGFENRNRKPNYNSVMSYNYQFGGVDNDCFPDADGVLDYSSGLNASLDENNLDETQGICGGVAVDWDQDGNATETSVVADINHSWNGAGPYPAGDGSLNVLQDYNDWANIFYAGILDADGAIAGLASSVETAICQEVPENMR